MRDRCNYADGGGLDRNLAQITTARGVLTCGMTGVDHWDGAKFFGDLATPLGRLRGTVEAAECCARILLRARRCYCMYICSFSSWRISTTGMELDLALIGLLVGPEPPHEIEE